MRVNPRTGLEQAALAGGTDQRASGTPPGTATAASETRATKASINLPVPTVDGALDRLEHLLQRQRQFAADASHHLRTPLAALRIQLEEALLYPDDVDPHAALSGALHAAEQLQQVVADLLQLAQLVTREATPHDHVDLSSLVNEEIARRPTPRMSMQVQPKITVPGDHALLTRLLRNLLDHAQCHFPTQVELTLTRHHDHAVLTVADGVTDAENAQQPKSPDHFIRMDTARHSERGNCGLGLTLAHDIAFAHNGTLLVDNGPHRLTCRLPMTSSNRPTSRQ